MIPLKVHPSLTLALLARVREMRAQGVDVASFAAGEPDFDTPNVVIKGAHDGMQKGDTRYVATPGLDSLREGIAEDYRKRLKAKWVKKENVIVTAGAKQGIYLSFAAILEQGDEVLVPRPFWVSYPHIIEACHGRPLEFATQAANGFFPTVEELEAAYRPRVKALIFSSPGNPTGRMIRKNELQAIVDWCVKRKVILLYDEIYERLVLGKQPHVCPLALVAEAGAEYVLSINAFSKSLAMTGWRLGYVVSHAQNIQALSPLHGQMLTSLPGFIQQGAQKGLKIADKFLKPVVKRYQKRMRMMEVAFDKIPHIKYLKAEGAFYICVDVRELMQKKSIPTDDAFAEKLLREEKVVVLPGSSMGMPGWLRFSFATNEAEIKKGLQRFERFCRV